MDNAGQVYQVECEEVFEVLAVLVNRGGSRSLETSTEGRINTR